MKKILFIPLFVGLTSFSSAATRGDVQIIKSSEGIVHISNKIMKNYLVAYFGKNSDVKNSDLLFELGKELRNISQSTSNEPTKDIVNFLTYNKSELNEELKGEITKEKISKIIDYIDGFIEGSKSMFTQHRYNFSESEKMLMLSKNMSSILDEIAIYYSASKLGINTELYETNLEARVIDFDKKLNILVEYEYGPELKEVVLVLKDQWLASKIILNKEESIL